MSSAAGMPGAIAVRSCGAKRAAVYQRRRPERTAAYQLVRQNLETWLALDDCDIENGCLQVVPGTQNLPILCTVQADTAQSFTDVTVPIPDGMQREPVLMKAGDVLFFNGQLVHGSFPNTSADRFWRALIGHYIVGEAQAVAKFYHPVLCMDGTLVELGESEGGSECGVWVDEETGPIVAMQSMDRPMAMVTE